jgi:hypothetical protein
VVVGNQECVGDRGEHADLVAYSGEVGAGRRLNLGDYVEPIVHGTALISSRPVYPGALSNQIAAALSGRLAAVGPIPVHGVPA